MAQIVVSRPRKGYWAPLSLEIILDGKKVAALRRGEEVAIDVEPGLHTVKTRVDWKLSPVPRTLISRTVEFDVADRDRVRVTCRSPKREYYAGYSYWFRSRRSRAARQPFIRPDRYIEVEVRIDRDEPQGATE